MNDIGDLLTAHIRFRFVLRFQSLSFLFGKVIGIGTQAFALSSRRLFYFKCALPSGAMWQLLFVSSH
jgi:hypothetical protein